MEIEELLQRAGVLKQSRPQNLQGKQSWYEIKDLTDESEIYIYDEISMFGITAAQFAEDLKGINSNSIKLRLNSPGGDVFDGIAIYNLLKSHKAQINVSIDGIAASIASVIAMAGDSVSIAKNAQMMIHDAHGLTIGTADDMREMAELLDASSDIIAGIYQEKAGGMTKTWRNAMKKTSWYRGKEAVDAGLADSVIDMSPQKNEVVLPTGNEQPVEPVASAVSVDWANLFKDSVEEASAEVF